MKGVKLVLMDRKRAQRGSVLSGVLIIVAFLAIVGGAMMTELTTSFLVSRNLVNRVTTQATVNSAMELQLDQIQNTPLNSPCTGVNPLPLNGRTAAVTVLQCAPVIDQRSNQLPTQIASSSSQFSVDGTHAQLSGLNDYVVADAGGTVYDYPFGQTGTRWSLALGGTVTAPVLVTPDQQSSGQFLDLVPMSGTSCLPSSYCINVISDDGSSSPSPSQCPIGNSASVTTKPAIGRNFGRITFFADVLGGLFAYDISQASNGDCDPMGSSPASGAEAVGGPIVFKCVSGCAKKTDEVFLLTSTPSSSQLVQYTYTNGNLTLMTTQPLPWGSASGLAVDGSTLPARVAITFNGGGVAMVRIDSGANMTLAVNTLLPSGVSAAPFWCRCPASTDLIGVGAQNGALYILDASLNAYATYPAGGAQISTTPAADAAGDWFFGADDGYLYEVQARPPAVTLAKKYGPMGRIGSSVQVGACPAGICIYMGSLNQNAYMVPLDARYAVMTACLTTAPPACSGANPRLWAQVEVGVAGSPQTVHVQGWSYYSP